jgi:thioredoxin 2
MNALSLDENGLVVACASCGQRNRIAYERLAQPTRCGRCKTAIPAPGTPVTVDSEEHFDELIGLSALPVLVDFWAPWCGPCKMVAPEFEKVAAASAGELIVAKVNTEQVPSLAGRYGIQAIPTLMLFSGGKEIARESGARPAQAIQEFVRQNLAGASV